MPMAMIVDDSKVDQRLAGKLLECRSGLAVRYAGDGEAAMSSIAEERPDIVITDLQMPHMHGLELVRALREQYPAIPVVLMTSVGSEDVAAEALRHGAASYVPKRLLSRDLALIVERLLTATDVQREHEVVIECCRLQASRFELGNDASLAPPLIQHLKRELGRLNWCDETDLMRIGVALDEAIANAITHGNLEGDSALREESLEDYQAFLGLRRTQSPYAERHVHVHATISPTEARYTVADEGPGFDPATLPDPTDPANIERTYGRGLLLIRTFMDEVSHNESGNAITMVKRRTPQRAD